ncbi:hypothetical protein N791_03630 [Lysobacter defluvii IMMIB APB-9 = DSM 18482]|uniref:Uncharacterized protein n=1 Tax=Lysobacter defluvii IMMIB APB-9 = DSM 18482 TaxID=1385515 RepID=A0A0A0M5D5_9GAMM|nr:hypothetical protein N791_03630 [Lysobacter defluvii IMMIB APB-9 = DSM 18482]
MRGAHDRQCFHAVEAWQRQVGHDQVRDTLAQRMLQRPAGLDPGPAHGQARVLHCQFEQLGVLDAVLDQHDVHGAPTPRAPR